MKKRNYLSPHTWQRSNISNDSLSSIIHPRKHSLKIGRYVALLCLALIVFFLLFHHSNNHSKPLLSVAEVGPTIQTIALPTADASPTSPSRTT